jgi:hypothetical protein
MYFPWLLEHYDNMNTIVFKWYCCNAQKAKESINTDNIAGIFTHENAVKTAHVNATLDNKRNI